jgi:hypothetical protein
MPATLTLGTLPPPALQNTSTLLAITTSADTVTITVDVSYPRIVMFQPTVDAVWRLGNSANATIPANTALTLEVPVNSVFTVAGASASGNLVMTVLR